MDRPHDLDRTLLSGDRSPLFFRVGSHLALHGRAVAPGVGAVASPSISGPLVSASELSVPERSTLLSGVLRLLVRTLLPLHGDRAARLLRDFSRRQIGARLWPGTCSWLEATSGPTPERAT